MLAAACGSDDDVTRRNPFVTLEDDASFPGTPGDAAQHASLFEFTPLADCEVSNPADLGIGTELRIFRGPGVTEGDLRAFFSGLQRYYSQYGVTMSTRYDVIDVPFTEAMILDMNALAARVEAETGLDLNGSLTTEEEALVTASIGRGVLHNVRELIRVYATPRREFTDVILLAEMVTKELPPELAKFRGLAGLGLSPELLGRVPVDDPAAQLYDWLGVSDDFTPLAVVGVGPVKTHLENPDIVMAHEIGHTYGLVHTVDVGNLLHQGETDCWLELNSSQLEEIRLATGAIAHTGGVEALSLTTRAGEFVTAVKELLARR
jgi:hypothetical protein